MTINSLKTDKIQLPINSVKLMTIYKVDLNSLL